jgi:hypothetical protein
MEQAYMDFENLRGAGRRYDIRVNTREELMELLYKNGVTLGEYCEQRGQMYDVESNLGISLIDLAAASGDINLLRFLRALPRRKKYQVENTLTPNTLIMAVQSGNIALVQFLLQQNACLPLTNAALEEASVLHQAPSISAETRMEMIHLLLAHNCPTNGKCYDKPLNFLYVL